MTRQSKALSVIPARNAAQRRSRSASESTGKLPLMLSTSPIGDPLGTAGVPPALHLRERSDEIGSPLQSCPRLSRASTSFLRRLSKQDVDGRDKPGHDSE